MTRTGKIIALWAIMGAVYLVMEGVFRAFNGGSGWVNIAMLPIGGLCGIAVGSINQNERFYTMPVILQSLIGTVIVLAVEFIAGCILNLWLGLGIWDYSRIPGNVLGQICLPFALLWFLIMPFAIWLEDWLRWRLWGEGEPYTLGNIYWELVTLK